jgi:type II secretion system protein I
VSLPKRTPGAARGFTLIEVLVALMVVAMGLAALMTAVSGAARTSGYLRDKTLAQWIALNRLSEVRLTANKLAAVSPVGGSSSGQSGDTAELQFGGRTWHYDTRYYDTSIATMKRVVVRVWAGDAKSKSNPIDESISFIGTSVATPGASNVPWTVGNTATQTPCQPGTNGTSVAGATPGSPNSITATGAAGVAPPCTPAATGTGATTIPPTNTGTGATGTQPPPITPQ